jgi:SAM-dependent methyltransferase
MQAYSNKVFARVYSARCSGLARRLAPLICDFYERTEVAEGSKSILDLGCGTGQLILYFLSRGYKAVGIDLSEHMLSVAEENACQYVQSGHARFVQADASDFTLDERFGLVVSTDDALNHLEDEQSLQRCFQCVRAVNDGYFIFDLNTRRGLRQCNNILLDDSTEDTVLINRGIYDGNGSRAWTSFTGFLRTPSGLYERFDETLFNTIFQMEAVKNMLLESGWSEVRFCRIWDLGSSLLPCESENEGRVLIVARA